MESVIHHGDCLEVLRGMADGSVDAVVTDPPYGLSFMGKRWDYDVPSEEVWAECLRVLKPGGHLLAFAGTRTQHRMAVRIEDAGFEIRDLIAWVYGSGFPKSLDVSKAIDKAAGAEREVICDNPNNRPNCAGKQTRAMSAPITVQPITAPATDAAKQWAGWGTALKPSMEPITVARKPLDGTVAENVLRHGTGAMNVDGCRVDLGEEPQRGKILTTTRAAKSTVTLPATSMPFYNDKGRWPANLIHDGSDEVVGLFPDSKSPATYIRSAQAQGEWLHSKAAGTLQLGHNDTGSAARFFYCAKASKADRDAGCEGLEAKRTAKLAGSDNDRTDLDPVSERFRTSPSRNHHPTVKPTDLMRYLCRLVTPPNGTVLDPFTGSGSTGIAAQLEGFNFIGIEREAEYVAIARARIAAIHPTLF